MVGKLPPISTSEVQARGLSPLLTGHMYTLLVISTYEDFPEITSGNYKFEVTSVITKASADRLGLDVGSTAYAVVKSSDVMVAVD
jgi:hypothetical protein